jgi:4-hydroxy-3-methylbut-2-enyl diphosphate reductase
VEIIVSKEAGFCFGVKRAIRLTMETVEKDQGHVYTLGPLIHNPQVIQQLESRGVLVVQSIDEINSGTVVLRSHGITPKLYQQIVDAGLHIVDAVCPNVKKVQEIACKLKKEGYTVVVVGEKNHPEVMSIIGTIEGDTFVIESVEEVKKLHNVQKIGVVAQTTQTCEHFRNVVSCLLHNTFELRAFHTICDAVEKRQQDSLRIARMVDVMIVIGGRNSANTTRLARICSEVGCKTYHIETGDEIQPAWLKGVKKIGVTAGASTPPWIIEDVLTILKRW